MSFDAQTHPQPLSFKAYWWLRAVAALVLAAVLIGCRSSGDAVCDGGLMVDLSRMNGVHVDPEAQVVRVEGGATWGDVDRGTQAFGLATSGGVVSTTGVAGLTLGGGLGWLRRKHGLSCDNLISADVVTAEGERVTAGADENPDLFWALRGGGGNFGGVTSFEFELHEVGPEVMFAGVMYPMEEAGRLLPAWRDFMAEAPEEISSQAMLWTVPEMEGLPEEAQGRPVCMMGALYSGDPEEGRQVLGPLRELSDPVLDMSGVMPYTAVQSSQDHESAIDAPPGMYRPETSLTGVPGHGEHISLAR